MTVATHPATLRELIALLSNHELDDVTAIVDRALLALDDPESYLSQFPDEEWLVEGYDLSFDQQSVNDASLRLLHWVVFDDLSDWLIIGDKADELTERVIDRLSEDGIAIADPPPSLATLQAHCDYLNSQLSALAAPHAPKQLLEFDVGVNDEIGFFIVSRDSVARIANLAQQLQLRIRV